MQALQFIGLAIGAVFEPGSVHTATLTVRNPSSVDFDYTGELFLGITPDVKAASQTEAFSLLAGEQKAVSFIITAPIAEAVYHVYVDIYHNSDLIAAYQAYEDVQVYAEAMIDIIDIIWT